MGEYDVFIEKHRQQLEQNGIPSHLWTMLHYKLDKEIYDVSVHSHVCLQGDDECHIVCASRPWAEGKGIFLIDHLWMTAEDGSYDALSKNHTLQQRLYGMFFPNLAVKTAPDVMPALPSPSPQLSLAKEDIANIIGVPIAGLCNVDDLDLDERCIAHIGPMHLPSIMPKIEKLSLWGNKLQDLGEVCEVLSQLPHLKAVWLNDNPLLGDTANVISAVDTACAQVEVINSKLSSRYGDWALSLLGNSNTVGDVVVLDLRDRGLKELKPDVFRKCEQLLHLDIRQNHQLDVKKSVDVLKTLPRLVSLNVDIPSSVTVTDLLASLPFLQRLNGHVVCGNECEKGGVEDTLRECWRYFRCVRVSKEEEALWCMMDEYGSSVRHNDQPNVRLVPLMYSTPQGGVQLLTVMYNVKEINEGEELTCDWMDQEDLNGYARSAKLINWLPHNRFSDLEQYVQHARKIHKYCSSGAYIQRRQVEATARQVVMKFIADSNSNTSCDIVEKSTLKVYTNFKYIADALGCGGGQTSYVIVEDKDNADVVFSSEHVQDFESLRRDQMINQIPYESAIISKNLLAHTITKYIEQPNFLPLTYDLQSDLLVFVEEYRKQRRDKLHRIWLSKPIMMAHSYGMYVCDDDICKVLRTTETRDRRLVQGYIDKPCLLEGKFKFDIRVYVCVRSIKPLEVYVCNTMGIRLSNNAYNTNTKSISDYTTHFTIVCYKDEALIQKHYCSEEYEETFDNEHGSGRWKEVTKSIHSVISQVFTCFSHEVKGTGWSHCRAVYGLDFMLDNDYSAKLLECTYMPDMTRIVNFNPHIIRQVFDALYGTVSDGVVKLS